jgi:hypothetical protein
MMRHGTHRAGRTAALAAGALAAAVVVGLAGCGSGSGSDTAGPTTADPVASAVTAPAGAGSVYVQALDEATSAMTGIATAILDPNAPTGTRGPRIEAELTRLDAAATAMQGIQLSDATVDAQRKDLLAAIPPFDTAMRAVLAAGQQDPVNGGLELVQQRGPILAGVDATLAADAGAITALGDSARAALTKAQAELQRQLTDLKTQAAG